MLANLKRCLGAAVVLAALYGTGAKDASAASIWITYIYYYNPPTDTVIHFGGNYSLAASEYSPSVNECWSVSSTGYWNNCGNWTWGSGRWDAVATADYYATHTTCHAGMQYYRQGTQYHTYTSYDLYK